MARRLGRGLGALISDTRPKAAEKANEAHAVEGTGVLSLPMALVVPSPWQPRKTFDEEKLHDLAESIKAQGLVQPVVVRRQGDKYELIAGERRYRAMERLEKTEIPAVVIDASDEKMRELALVENLQRDDLNPIEIAYAYQALQNDLGLTHEVIAERIGVSRASITNTLRLLDLPEEIKSLVSENQIAAGHARAILSLPDGLSQIRLARKVVDDGLSVREVERIVSGGKKKPGGKSAKAGKPVSASPHVQDIEGRLRDHLSTKVLVQDKGGKGTILIEYYSHEDVARILERIGLPGDPS